MNTFKSSEKSIILVLVFFILMSKSPLAQESRPTDTHAPTSSVTTEMSQEEADQWFLDAEQLFKNGKTGAAIYKLQQLSALDPTNYKVLFKLGEMAISEKNWAYSIEVFRKVSFIRPEDIEVRFILMDVYRAYQMPIQEIIIAKEILSLKPDSENALRRLSDLYKELDIPEDEIKTRQKLRDVQPDDYFNLKRLATLLETTDKGNLREAAKIYEQIRVIAPEKTEDLTRLAGIYDKLGKNSQTLEVLDHLEKRGVTRTWLKNRAMARLSKNPFPAPGTSWQWQLSGTIDTSVDAWMYDLDLFDTPTHIFDELHSKGRVVVCYFSAGTWEKWRTDKDHFPSSVQGKSLEDWPDEKWLDIRQLAVLAPVMTARLDLAVEKGCDGIEPDNIDGYSNKSGFPLTYDDQIYYNTWLADQAHIRGLSIGLKNDLNQVKDLVQIFDWALNEQCFQYNECEKLLPFVKAGKAVFGVEYEGNPDNVCPKANSMNFDWLFKKINLGAERHACR